MSRYVPAVPTHPLPPTPGEHFSDMAPHACLGHLALPSTSLQLALLFPTQPRVVLAAFRLPARATEAAAAWVLLTGVGTRPFASHETQIGKRLVHLPGASPLQPCSTRCCLASFSIPQTLGMTPSHEGSCMNPFSMCTSGVLIVLALQLNRVRSDSFMCPAPAVAEPTVSCSRGNAHRSRSSKTSRFSPFTVYLGTATDSQALYTPQLKLEPSAPPPAPRPPEGPTPSLCEDGYEQWPLLLSCADYSPRPSVPSHCLLMPRIWPSRVSPSSHGLKKFPASLSGGM